MVRFVILSFFLIGAVFPMSGKEKVTFYSADSIKITADLYLKDHSLPFIILLHQAEASRGEYSEIAPRLLKLGYNCLAVDLRAGSKINYVLNETAAFAKEMNYPLSLFEANKDLIASLSFVAKYNNKKVILFGSSFSASLCLIQAANTDRIKALIAFSPGEYFRPTLSVKDQIEGIDIPLFVSATNTELDYVTNMLSPIPVEQIRYYNPSKGNGEHGAKMLWDSCEVSDECWFELLMFFKKIRFN